MPTRRCRMRVKCRPEEIASPRAQGAGEHAVESRREGLLVAGAVGLRPARLDTSRPQVGHEVSHRQSLAHRTRLAPHIPVWDLVAAVTSWRLLPLPGN